MTEGVGVAEEDRAIILKQIREGRTLSSICESKSMPERDEVYALLRSDSAFAKQFGEAEDDRRRTWRDQAIKMIANFERSGDDNETKMRMSVVKMQSALLMAASKEQSLVMRTFEDGSGGQTVVIRKFLPDGEGDVAYDVD